MKKIALVTCYFQHNYGSQLQALATQMICEKMDWPHETIKIDGLKPEINKAKYKYFLSRIFDINTILDKMATVRKVVAQKTNPQYAKNSALRDSIFSDFANHKFRLSQYYSSKRELGEQATQYSAFIVGSDQLWLPSNITADYYTLNFVPNGIGVKKIAYATSFGISNLPEKQARMAQAFLPKLDSIMVREESGRKLVKKLIGKDIPVVCDPTLLFSAEEWDQFLPPQRRIAEPYILCYFLGNNPQQRNWAKSLAKEAGCKIAQLPHLDEFIKSDEGFADYPLYDVSPLDFVSLIRDAKYVLTDSFHCSVFSTLFEKQYFSFRRYSDDGTVSTNGRLYSLLDSFGLSHRMLKGDEPIAETMNQPIDYKSVLQRLDVMRKDSLSLLKQAVFPENS